MANIHWFKRDCTMHTQTIRATSVIHAHTLFSDCGPKPYVTPFIWEGFKVDSLSSLGPQIQQTLALRKSVR